MVRLTQHAVMGVIRMTRPRPVFRNSSDKLAFAVHASFFASGFFLHATGASAANMEFDSDSRVKVGTENWNEEDGRYNFVYFYPALDTIKVLVHMFSENGNLHIHVSKQNRITKLQIRIAQFVPVNEEISFNYQNLQDLVIALELGVINAYRR